MRTGQRARERDGARQQALRSRADRSFSAVVVVLAQPRRRLRGEWRQSIEAIERSQAISTEHRTASTRMAGA
jgi:hypothetical protein